MSNATITYGDERFEVTERVAADTLAITRIAVDSNQSVLRTIITDEDGSGAFLLLGPGCPISVQTDDLAGLFSLVEERAKVLFAAWPNAVQD